MNRRDYLKVSGATAVAGVGTYGVYRTIIQDVVSGGESPDGADQLQRLGDDDELAQLDDPRDGWHLLGVTPPSRDLTVTDPFESWLDQPPAVLGFFVDVGQPAGREIERLTGSLLENAWQRRYVPHLFFQPFLPERDSTSDNINREIATGEWDDQLETWAEYLAAWVYDEDGSHRRMYLNYAPEFNGDWSPWSPARGDDDESDFVEMWRRTHDIFREYGLDERFVQWVWTVDNTNRGVDRAACYPGDEYVDWCAVHGYNWATWAGWQSPAEVYDGTLGFVADVADKPLAITEFACSSETEEGDHDPAAKNDWLAESWGYLRDNDVRMSLYFDVVKETDWAVFDGDHGTETVEIDDQEYRSYPAYREGASEPGVLGPREEYERILTEPEFHGTW